MTTISWGDPSGVEESRSAEAPLTDDARRLAEGLARLVRVVQFRDRDRLSAYGVTSSQRQALEAVVEAGALATNQLAACLFVDKSTASRVADALVDKEYLTRHAHAGDGRAMHLLSNGRGEALCAAIRADEERDYATLLEELTPGARGELCRMIEQLVAELATGVETAGGRCCVLR